MPECANYYGDLEFQPEELVKAGVDPEVLGISNSQRSQSGQRVSNTFTEHIQFVDDNDFANFDEPILVPAKIPAPAPKLVPAKPPPPPVINSNRVPPQFRNNPQSLASTKAPKTTTTTTRRTTIATTTFVPTLTTIEDNTEAPVEIEQVLPDKILDIIDTVEEVDGDNPDRPQPAVVKAGEDYYYYYYYYDDEESLPDEDA